MRKAIEDIKARLNGDGYESDEAMSNQRKRLYRLNNDTLTEEEWFEKYRLLQCIKELLEDGRK